MVVFFFAGAKAIESSHIPVIIAGPPPLYPVTTLGHNSVFDSANNFFKRVVAGPASQIIQLFEHDHFNPSVYFSKLLFQVGDNGAANDPITWKNPLTVSSAGPGGIVNITNLTVTGNLVGGPWTKFGNNIYPTTLTNDVGVGKASPAGKFEVGNDYLYKLTSSGNPGPISGAGRCNATNTISTYDVSSPCDFSTSVADCPSPSFPAKSTDPLQCYDSYSTGGMFPIALWNYYALQQPSSFLLVAHSGNVGIGTQTPRSIFEASMGGGSSLFNIFSAGGPSLDYGTSGIGFNLVRKSTNVWEARHDGGNNAGAAIYGGIYNGLSFVTLPSTGANVQTLTDSAIMNNIRLRITSTGDVGIGTTNPAGKFEVKVGHVYKLTSSGNAGPISGAGRCNAANSNTAYNISSPCDFNDSVADCPQPSFPAKSTDPANCVDSYSTGGGWWSIALWNYYALQQPASTLLVSNIGNVGVGTTTPLYKLQIAGHTVPTLDNQFDLGQPSLRWNNFFVKNINMSGSFTGNATFTKDGDATNDYDPFITPFRHNLILQSATDPAHANGPMNLLLGTDPKLDASYISSQHTYKHRASLLLNPPVGTVGWRGNVGIGTLSATQLLTLGSDERSPEWMESNIAVEMRTPENVEIDDSSGPDLSSQSGTIRIRVSALDIDTLSGETKLSTPSIDLCVMSSQDNKKCELKWDIVPSSQQYRVYVERWNATNINANNPSIIDEDYYFETKRNNIFYCDDGNYYIDSACATLLIKPFDATPGNGAYLNPYGVAEFPPAGQKVAYVNKFSSDGDSWIRDQLLLSGDNLFTNNAILSKHSFLGFNAYWGYDALTSAGTPDPGGAWIRREPGVGGAMIRSDSNGGLSFLVSPYSSATPKAKMTLNEKLAITKDGKIVMGDLAHGGTGDASYQRICADAWGFLILCGNQTTSVSGGGTWGPWKYVYRSGYPSALSSTPFSGDAGDTCKDWLADIGILNVTKTRGIKLGNDGSIHFAYDNECVFARSSVKDSIENWNTIFSNWQPTRKGTVDGYLSYTQVCQYDNCN